MPLFQYVALNGKGQEVKGSLEAADPRSAASALRGRMLYVMQLSAGRAGVPSLPTTGSRLSLLGLVRPVWTQDLIFFFQQLALMLQTGLTVLQALEVCEEQATKARLRFAVRRIGDAIRAGKSFSQAMALESRLFSSLTVKLIESAEASGELDVVLGRVAADLEYKQDLKRKLLTSLTYPMIVVLTAVGVTTFLVWKVIPKFAAFFARRGMSLPWTTQLLLDVSAFVTRYGLTILCVFAATIGVLTLIYLTRRGRMALDRAMLMVPIIGKLLTVASMSRFCQTLCVLLNSGVTLLDSLRISSQVIGNRAIAARLEASSEQILKGQDLAGSLRSPVIPPLVCQVVAVGERTGALSPVLQKLGEFYGRDLEARIRIMSTLIEPVMIVIVGGIVGFVYFSFFQAIFQLAAGGR